MKRMFINSRTGSSRTGSGEILRKGSIRPESLAIHLSVRRTVL